MNSDKQCFNECEKNCPFYGFYKNSKEAVFITRRDGIIVSANESMENLLGYDIGTLPGIPVSATYDSQSDRDDYCRAIEKNGFVHNYQLTLKKKDGTPIICLIDAVTWKEDGKIIGYHGIIKTRTDIVDSFQKFFIRLKEEEKNFRQQKEVQSDSLMMMKYLPDDIIKSIQNSEINPLANEKRKATILFFDIRNSTRIAENLPSDVFASLLSDMFTDIMDLIYGNGGFVNKMLGDGIMATFGCPVSSEDAAFKAVLAAVQIQNYLNTFNDVRPDYLDEPLKAGIGIATGTVFSGVIGSVRFQEYTVLGDAVNTASRLESFTKIIGENIIVDEKTYSECKSLFNWKELPDIGLRGKKDKINAYAI